MVSQMIIDIREEVVIRRKRQKKPKWCMYKNQTKKIDKNTSNFIDWKSRKKQSVALTHDRATNISMRFYPI